MIGEEFSANSRYFLERDGVDALDRDPDLEIPEFQFIAEALLISQHEAVCFKNELRLRE